MVAWNHVAGEGLRRQTVPIGPVVFYVVNKGGTDHTFTIPPLGYTPWIKSDGHFVLHVTFKKPGRYYYLCTVPEHNEFGQFGWLTVR